MAMDKPPDPTQSEIEEVFDYWGSRTTEEIEQHTQGLKDWIDANWEEYTKARATDVYPQLFGSVASAVKYIREAEFDKLYPNYRVVWVGFEYDAKEGGYFIRLNPETDGGRQTIVVRRGI